MQGQFSDDEERAQFYFRGMQMQISESKIVKASQAFIAICHRVWLAQLHHCFSSPALE